MSTQRIKELNAELLQARYAYYVLSAPVMSDPDYDAKERELKALVAEHPQAAKLANRNRTDFYKLLSRHHIVPALYKE